MIRFGHTACAIDNASISYIGQDIEGVVSGGNRNFCAIPESAYRSGAFDNIWLFSIAYADGRTQPVYCLEKGVRGPEGSPYRSMPASQCLPAMTDAQQARVNWILANGYPARTAAELFRCAGVDEAEPPVLTDNDAYAAVQVALWSVFRPPQDRDPAWWFVNCSNGDMHPKSARLQRLVAYLYDGAARGGQGGDAGQIGPHPGGRVARAGQAALIDFGPGPKRKACDKVLYGPLMVCSAAPFQLVLEPLCECGCVPGFITLADACGCPIQAPASGQEFYLAFPEGTGAGCYRLSILVERNLVSVATLCNLDAPPHLQAIGATPRITKRCECASLCVCYAPPCPCCQTVPCAPEPVCREPERHTPKKKGGKTQRGYR